jgi:hypothetical protein
LTIVVGAVQQATAFYSLIGGSETLTGPARDIRFILDPGDGSLDYDYVDVVQLGNILAHDVVMQVGAPLPPPDRQIAGSTGRPVSYDPELYDTVTPATFNGDVAWYRRKAVECGGPVLELGGREFSEDTDELVVEAY